MLREVDLIAAEDTRHSKKLLAHHDISTPMISYHEFNKIKHMKPVLEALGRGDVAIISDAGMPGLSDPGLELIRQVVQAGHRVSPVPGPTAGVTALVSSGLPSDTYIYLGYLPRKAAARRSIFEGLREELRTVIFFEAPHRIRPMLADLRELLGEDRAIVLCREMTKVHEEFLRGTIRDLDDHFADHEPKGEFTVVLEGSPRHVRWEETEVVRRLEEKLREGMSPSQAAREVARDSGWTRNEVYRLTLEDE